MYLCLGDLMVALGDHEKAIHYWRKYSECKEPPRYTDGCSSIAQLREIQGDYKGAIEAIREEISILASDWQTETGESVDQHYRSIARLQKKI